MGNAPESERCSSNGLAPDIDHPMSPFQSPTLAERLYALTPKSFKFHPFLRDGTAAESLPGLTSDSQSLEISACLHLGLRSRETLYSSSSSRHLIPQPLRDLRSTKLRADYHRTILLAVICTLSFQDV